MTISTDDPYRRTCAGKVEIRRRQCALTREARHLLRVMAPSSPAAHWLHMVGCGREELQQLVDAGLVAPARVTVEEAVREWRYGALSTLLTHEARPERVGLFDGFRMARRIESCEDVGALRALAVELVGRIRASHGEASARRLSQRLGATD